MTASIGQYPVPQYQYRSNPITNRNHNPDLNPIPNPDITFADLHIRVLPELPKTQPNDQPKTEQEFLKKLFEVVNTTRRI